MDKNFNSKEYTDDEEKREREKQRFTAEERAEHVQEIFAKHGWKPSKEVKPNIAPLGARATVAGKLDKDQRSYYEIEHPELAAHAKKYPNHTADRTDEEWDRLIDAVEVKPDHPAKGERLTEAEWRELIDNA